MKFYLGLGNFFSPYERNHKVIMRRTVEEEFGIHYSLQYVGSDHFFRRLTTRAERSRISTIVKVPCFNSKVLINEVNQTLKNLDIEKIDVLQLWGGNEVFDSLDQESQLFADLQALKDAGKINTFLPQLYYTQTIELAKRNIALAPIAFYGSPFGIDISPDALDKTNLAGSVAMHIHGGGDFATVPVFISELQKRNWYLLKNELSKSTFSLAYLSSLGFVSKVVGSTRNNAHFDEVVQFFRSKNTLAATDKILTQQVAIQNCRTDNEGPTNVGNTWPVRQRGIRARITYLRYLGAFHAAKHKRLHNYLKALKIIPMILPH